MDTKAEEALANALDLAGITCLWPGEAGRIIAELGEQGYAIVPAPLPLTGATVTEQVDHLRSLVEPMRTRDQRIADHIAVYGPDPS